VPNRLADELSPYLQQHAHNPVDWYPWGDEAIERARAEDKPIFLSIGYSACHWCHVMERESFDDPDTAAVLNARFISIKVDREERPDLDQVYQLAVQIARRGGGGWPLSVFLTPSLKPFYAGTYFPPADRYGMPAFRRVLDGVWDAFAKRRADVERSSEGLTQAIGEVAGGRLAADGALSKDAMSRASAKLTKRFDEAHGGFGTRPKFPNSLALELFLRAEARGDDAHRGRLRAALDGMRDGGVYDQLGFGFHRYSTDERWLVPHFEKMLYDNALLCRLYVEAWRAHGEPADRRTAEEILTYVEREMTAPEGLFYSSQDADSEGEEGKFFVWSPEELDAILDPAEAAAAKRRWGVREEGNFEGSGKTVLHVAASLEDVAAALAVGAEEARAHLDSAREKLLTAREGRVAPFKDEKRLAAWNGLMIEAAAMAGAAFDAPRWRRLATRALSALRETLFTDGRLRRLAKDGVAKGEGFLEDHAHVANAALEVYEATSDPEALAFARTLVDLALERFADADGPGFFFAPASDDLVVRGKDPHDGATPSGTSSMVHALLRLHAHLGQARYLEAAEETLTAFGPDAVDHPLGHANLAAAVDRYVHGPVEIVVVAEDGEGEALLDAARRAYVPNRVLLRLDPNAAPGAGAGALLEGRGQVDGRPTAYVCRGRACSLPVTDPDALTALLEERA
jgi:uncharacterized protein YyaL (SSP411 family)